MWGGANAFNSSQDGDTGPLNLLPHPPPVPKRLAAFGLAWMGAGVLLSLAKGLPAFGLTLLGFCASVYYSWVQPYWKRGKELPGLDILINAGGCGLGSVLAGYAFTSGAWNARVVWVGIAFTVAIFGGLPTSQIFQLAPDHPGAREKNYTSWLGAKRTLRVGAVLILLHLAILVWVSGGFVPSLFFGAWFGLAAAGALHSFLWSFSPFVKPYARMLRQFVLMSLSQVAWIVFALAKDTP